MTLTEQIEAKKQEIADLDTQMKEKTIELTELVKQAVAETRAQKAE